MQKSGFFNALISGDIPDRQYNAADYSDNLAVVISSGVLRSTNDDLKVTAAGMAVSVAAGRAWIKGHYYNNTDVYDFTATTAPTGGSRYDRVMLRLDESINGRSISLVYVQGTASNNPVPPEPTRDGDIYDLVLADVYVGANATSVTVTDKRADTTVCGWVYSTSGDGSFFTSLDTSFNEWFEHTKDTLSSVTLFKRYTDKITLASAASAVSFNIPQYDAETCFIEVYVNGILDTRYTLNNNVITFAGLLIAGTEVTVYAFKSIDGTDIMSVSDEITELQQQFATLDGVAKFTYKCTGASDNVSLSQIAQAFYTGSYVPADVTDAANAFLTRLGGNTYLASLPSDCQITIDVVGKCGVGAAVAGQGTSSSYARYFFLGSYDSNPKRIIFDFAKCDKINMPLAANTYNIIFFGTDLHIRNVNIYAYCMQQITTINMFGSVGNPLNIHADDCIFKIITTGSGVIAKGGIFTNCKAFVSSTSANTYCFDADNGNYTQVIGGRYVAYCPSGKQSAPFNINSGVPNGVIMVHSVNCPTVTNTGFVQTKCAIANAGKIYIDGIITTLTTTGTGVSFNGVIAVNKP